MEKINQVKGFDSRFVCSRFDVLIPGATKFDLVSRLPRYDTEEQIY